jgi:hypothetical protein
MAADSRAAILGVIAAPEPGDRFSSQRLHAKMMQPQVKPAGDHGGWRRRIKSTGIRM